MGQSEPNLPTSAFYEFMREVAPGDIIFSFKDTLIQAIGVATDYCFEAPKPTEFGTTGTNWSRIGWKVPVQWNVLLNRIRPSEHMNKLGPLLPSKYAPLRANGHGLQAVYLASVPKPMAMERLKAEPTRSKLYIVGPAIQKTRSLVLWVKK